VTLLLSPIVPHFAEEIWQSLGYGDSIMRTAWPGYREDALEKDEIEIAVQVNGKLRSRFLSPADVNDEFLQQRAMADEKILKFIGGRVVKKVIVVKKKLVNIVI
jgi:leucyl-tRNA synthetase